MMTLTSAKRKPMSAASLNSPRLCDTAPLVLVFLVLDQILQQASIDSQGTAGANLANGVDAEGGVGNQCKKPTRRQKKLSSSSAISRHPTHPTAMLSAVDRSDTKLSAIVLMTDSKLSGGIKA